MMNESTYPSRDVRPIRVLFADDDEDTLVMLGKAAEYIGHFYYKLARDGAEVIDLMNREEFDVLCLDVEMPVAYGTTIASQIRSVDSGIPIIFLTGRSGREVRSTAHQTGATILSKPADAGYLVELIESLARHRSQYHGPDRRIMSLNTSGNRRRSSDKVFSLPNALKNISHVL